MLEIGISTYGYLMIAMDMLGHIVCDSMKTGEVTFFSKQNIIVVGNLKHTTLSRQILR